LWANMHPSVIVTVVPFGAALAGGGLLLLLRRGRVGEETRIPPGIPSVRQLKVVAGVLVADVLASLVNPRGIEILTLPFQLAASPWFTQEINELQRPSFGLYPGPYVLAALLLLSFIALRRRSSLVPALMVLPFAYLGLSAVRFIFVFAIVGAPVLARNVTEIALAWSGARSRRPAMALAAAALAACAGSGVLPPPRGRH